MSRIFAVCFGLACFAQASPAALREPLAAKGVTETKLDTADIVILAKSAIVALDQANRTGNYAVLRDLGSPVFQEKFDQTALTTMFAEFRDKNISMAAALVVTPAFTCPPQIDEDNRLSLTGLFETQPLQIRFKLHYLQVGRSWQIDGIDVEASPPSNSLQAQCPFRLVSLRGDR